MKPEGFLTISKLVRADGKTLSTQRAVDLGIIQPRRSKPSGWGIEKEEIPLGYNLFVDSGRQLMAYCLGGRSPLSNYFCQKFGIGTGTTAPTVTDTSLESPIILPDGATTKEISGVDYPTAFVARIECSLGAADGNGYLITEFGLFSGNNTLIARSTELGINKTSDFAPVVCWRLRT